MQKVVVECDGCGHKGEAKTEDWATLHVPWRGDRKLDICRGCVAKLTGWAESGSPKPGRTIRI